MEMKTPEVTVPIDLVFRGHQLQLWHLLDMNPKPTWVLAEIMELPTKNISKQLQQMVDRTGLVKFERNGKLKSWYISNATQETKPLQERIDELEGALKGMYSRESVDNLLKKAISNTMQGMLDYFESDNVFVVDKTTKQRVDNAEIEADKNKRPIDFIYPLLEKAGIKIIIEPAT